VRVLPPDAEVAEAVDGTEAVADVDGVYLPWLRSTGYEAVMIRPDYYVFGGVASVTGLPILLDELSGQLGLTR
jgi:flavoprotein hydroxylase